ncbi:MAG: DUF3822 family protein [Bacteroidota bacterium]
MPKIKRAANQIFFIKRMRFGYERKSVMSFFRLAFKIFLSDKNTYFDKRITTYFVHSLRMSEQACSNSHQPYQSQIPIALQNIRISRALCRLILTIETDRCTILLLSAAEEIIFCQQFYNHRQLSPEVFWRLILENEAVFQEVYVDVRVYASDAGFGLIPNTLYEPAAKLALARLMLDDWAFSDEVQVVNLSGMDCKMLYLVSPSLRRLLNEYLPHHRISHLALPILLHGIGRAKEDAIVVRVLGKKVLILVNHSGQLQLFNQFDWQAASDVLYYLVACSESCRMDLHQARIFFFSLGEHAEIKDLLEQYIPNLIWQGTETAQPGPARAKQIDNYAFLASEFRRPTIAGASE